MVDEIKNFVDFLVACPTAFHTVEQIKNNLQAQGFIPLATKEHLHGGRGYFTTTEGTVVAFYIPSFTEKEFSSLSQLPIKLWAAHTDSPSLKIKPYPDIVKHKYVQIGVEVYGGAILNTWLDRPLAVAGKVFCRNPQAENKIQEHKVHVREPWMVIPSAAIHLNRDINKGFALNPDTHLPAFFSALPSVESSTHRWLSTLAEYCGSREEDVLSHDLFLYDPQPPVLLGKQQELINSSRLDNLAMVHAGLRGWERAIAKTEKKGIAEKIFIPAIAFFNHEEVGSMTYEGAGSALLLREIESFYKRISLVAPNLDTSLSQQNSFLISADMAHGFHPSYEGWYEGNHRPILNGGPVIKYNASFRYSSTASSSAQVKKILSEANLPCQEYLHHAEIPCGSTIGPVLSSRLSIPAVDIGSSLWAMHSIRETAGVHDHRMMIEFAEKYFSSS